MTRVWNLRALVIAMAAAVLLAVLLDASRDPVAEPASDIQAPGGTFQSRAAFCPPPFPPRLGAQNVALAADPGAPAAIRVQPHDSETSELADRRLLMRRVEGPAIDAVAYGAVLHAAALISMDDPASGTGAARCPRTVAERWYFPAGSVALGYDQRVLIRNPFPDEAVVNFTFYTPTGPVTKANLQDVAVPAGDSLTVKLNDFILGQKVLGTSVDTERGRIVAWTAMFAEAEDRPDGVHFSLGAPSPSLEWYFPDGSVGDGLEEVITLLNPYKRESIVTVSLAVADGRLQPPKLVEVRIPPEAIKTLSLPNVLGGRDQSLGGVGAIVQSTNGVGVVAERTVWYAAGRTGVASSIGARTPATQWVVLPAAVSSTEDALVVLNPGDSRALVRIELWRQDGAPLTPDWTTMRIKPGARARLVLNQATEGQPVAVLVTSDEPVVAERVATASKGDVSSLMGNVSRLPTLVIEEE